MKIAIDIDNTISRTTEYIGNIAIKFDREILHKNNVIDFNKTIPRSPDWTSEELSLFLKNYFEELINIPLLEDADKYIKKLKDAGYHIIIITARGEKPDDFSDEITGEYLVKNKIPYDELIVKCSNKFRFLNGVDFFIDDSIKECEGAVEHTDCQAILMSSELNSGYKNEKVYNAKNWKDVYNFIINFKN